MNGGLHAARPPFVYDNDRSVPAVACEHRSLLLQLDHQRDAVETSTTELQGLQSQLLPANMAISLLDDRA